MKIATMVTITINMTNKEFSMNRRSFFGSLATATGVALILPLIAKAERKRGGGTAAAGAALKLVDPKDGQAKSVNYVHNHSEIKDKALMTDRAGVKFADQKCHGCVFYQADKEATIDGKKAAPCQMPFATGKAVASEGWCSSWAKKA